ncbi:MAG: hypothetical protein IJC66_11195, partial [Kiritimatiellae bacterium]|nr:hypothetical protein [Kiritimatiellia bacterium]
MKIKSILAQDIRIPLDVPKQFRGHKLAYRDYVVVTITTESGLSGWSFVWSSPGVSQVIEAVAPKLIGESATEIRKIWNKVYQSICKWGRGGIGMRALAGIDNA